jgi:uncharacterized protein YbaP (TraB family)
MNLRNISFLFLLSIIGLSQMSCKASKETINSVPTAAPQSMELEKSLLWEVTGNGLTKPSYVYGTIHIIGSDDFFLPKGTLSAIDQADELIFEIDMNEMTDITSQMSLLKDVFMKDDLSIKDLLSEADYKVVSDHFEKMGLPLFFFEKMKPMFLTVFASTDFDPSGLQNGSMKSYEFEFFEMANKSSKPVSGLETIAFQMGIFDKIPYKDQATMLVESIKNSDVGGAQFAEMIRVYKAQDIDAMVSMISEDDSGMGEFEDILVDGRNKNWIPIMKEKMAAKQVFFAVGAGHLGGKNGVINLLKKEGYSLKPLSSI